MPSLILAHDIGTSGDKATLFSTDGSLVSSATSAYQTRYFNATWAEQNPDDWWKAVAETTKALLSGRDAGEVGAVAFSGQMMGCVCADRHGNPLRNAIIWADQRAVAEIADLTGKISVEEGYRITGHRISPSYSLAKLLWVKRHEPEVYRGTFKVLNAKDFIVRHLTGRWCTDYTDAGGTNLFDLGTFGWSGLIADVSGIDGEKLPELLPSTAVAGTVTREAAEETGLAAGTPVVCGAGDGMCAAVGAGCIGEGSVYSYLGSSAWIAMTTREPVFDPAMRTFTWPHAVPGSFSPCGTMQAAGSSFTWLKDAVYARGSETARAAESDPFEIIDALIEGTPAGADGLLFLPYLIGERSPWWNPDARGAFVGLKMEHGRGHLFRAVVEGVFLNMSLILEVFEPYLKTGVMDVIGGLARGGVRQRIMADVYGMEIAVPELLEEATSMGAAVIGGVGTGMLGGFDSIERFIRRRTVVEPDPGNSRMYARRRRIFERCYRNLGETFRDLASE